MRRFRLMCNSCSRLRPATFHRRTTSQITCIVIGVGGFLGTGEKDVIVPFTAVKTAKKNDKWWLTLDETKDDLKGAPGFKYWPRT
ncbi:PRC-barrel domain-containing protein [Bradyrhizobium niftali]|jgi:PRC-barrel domain|uniref:PRC-barrel domain-containing protein n=1 Tax=Bradyrhizobium niftali TaxID=2560055 RepID=UPI001F18F238|nr:PRC-barrel domain-containing protein [Bradyrhizobium niftali]